MINKISEIITDEMIKLDIIDNSDNEAYAYGTELFILKTVFYVMIILIAVFTKTLLTGCIFTAAYLAVRQYSGGYHCSSPYRCMLVSALMYTAMIAFYGQASIIFPVLSSAALIPVFLFAPCESENNPLTEQERILFRKKAVSVSLIISVMAWASYLCGMPQVYYPLSWSLAATAVLMIIFRFQQKSKNERNGQE